MYLKPKLMQLYLIAWSCPSLVGKAEQRGLCIFWTAVDLWCSSTLDRSLQALSFTCGTQIL